MPKLNSVEYWKEREKSKLNKGLKDISKLESQLAKEYKKAMSSISKEVAYMFSKYAKENKLDYAEASRYLNNAEFKDWKYDIKEYVKLIKETGDEQLLLELNTLAMRSRISRLEDLFYECDKILDGIYRTSSSSLRLLFGDTLTSNYYGDMYNIYKVVGIGTSFAKIDEEMIKDLLTYPWSGKDWSSRIWDNKSKLKKMVKEELTQCIIRGESTRTISKRLSSKLDADYKNCFRLINTEHSYFIEKASELAYKETGIEKYQYLASLDNKTCEHCQKLDLKIFNLSDAIIGINYPPLHPNTRSTTIPYFDEEELGDRFARDSKGKSIKVDANMNYEEWAKKFKV